MPGGRVGWLTCGVLLGVVVLGLAASWPTLAQEAGSTPTEAPTIRSETLGSQAIVIELFKQSIIINSIILGLSVIALLLFLYFMLTISSAALVPTRFVDDVVHMVSERNYKQAADYCRTHHRVFVASIVQRCLENASKPHALLMDIVDSEGRRRADVLWNRISYLSDISNVAPMFGLLGTVLGMIQVFFDLPAEAVSITSKSLSKGVGGAMSTTMFGLIVGIAALAFYSLIKSRATRALAEAEQVTHGISDMIKRESTFTATGSETARPTRSTT